MDKGLKHILEVYRLVRQNYLSRVDAAKHVGKANRITYETVMASCTKGINISTDDFDCFLEPENSSKFHAFLIKRFPNTQDQIDNFFSAFIEISDKSEKKSDKFVRTLFEDERKSLLNQLILKSLRDRFQKWSLRDDIPKDVREQLKDWLTKI
jgi:hypothetical protein